MYFVNYLEKTINVVLNFAKGRSYESRWMAKGGT